MIEELRTWIIRCDQCKSAYQIVTASQHPSLPAGWTTRTKHDCGMTGYSRTEHICGYCTECPSHG